MSIWLKHGRAVRRRRNVVKFKREIEGLESELGSQSDYRDTTRRLE